MKGRPSVLCSNTLQIKLTFLWYLSWTLIVAEEQEHDKILDVWPTYISALNDGHGLD